MTNPDLYISIANIQNLNYTFEKIDSFTLNIKVEFNKKYL